MKMIEERRRNLGQGGFTLIELLVVIAILAILAGVAVFAVNGLTTDADENACKLEKETLIIAKEAALASESSPPLVSNHLAENTYTLADGTVSTKYFTIEDDASSGSSPVAVADAPCS